MARIVNSLKLLYFLTAASGIMACLVITRGLLWSVLYYSKPGSFSPINHFISELGLTTSTGGADIFNWCLMEAGLPLAVFLLCLGYILGSSRLARFATVTGFFSTLSFSAIGYFPADNWTPHMMAAATFFCLAMLTVVLFSMAIYYNPQTMFSQYISFLGLFIAIWYAVALMWPRQLLYQSVYDPTHFIRPRYWGLPVLEWGYAFLIISWILLVSSNLLRKAREKK
jgi:hypothetical membrane protein